MTGATSAEDERSETPTQRYDRNWAELLQELRVLQTGVQILAGFLLTVPFQQRFTSLSTTTKQVYAATLGFTLVTIAVLAAPVVIHRLLFRRRLKGEIVYLGDRLAKTGMALLACSLTSAAFLVLDVTFGRSWAWLGGGALAAIFLGTWVALPTWAARHHRL